MAAISRSSATEIRFSLTAIRSPWRIPSRVNGPHSVFPGQVSASRNVIAKLTRLSWRSERNKGRSGPQKNSAPGSSAAKASAAGRSIADSVAA